MRCPFCGAEDTRVIDSRLACDGDAVRRRRECQLCSERYTTFEHSELSYPMVVKNDGKREAYQDEKLRTGLTRALEKRPVAAETIENILNRIHHRLRTSGEQEIESCKIGQWVMDELRDTDEVAYVRFASVYRRFQDVSAFKKEIERLENNGVEEKDERQSVLSFRQGKSAKGA